MIYLLGQYENLQGIYDLLYFISHGYHPLSPLHVCAVYTITPSTVVNGVPTTITFIDLHSTIQSGKSKIKIVAVDEDCAVATSAGMLITNAMAAAEVGSASGTMLFDPVFGTGTGTTKEICYSADGTDSYYKTGATINVACKAYDPTDSWGVVLYGLAPSLL